MQKQTSPERNNGLRVLLISPCGTHPAFEGNRRRILSLADQLQRIGYVVHLALLPNSKFFLGDLASMRRHWGSRLHVMYPADRWTPGFRLRRLGARWVGKLTRKPAKPNIPPLPGVDDFYLDWWNIELALLHRQLRFYAVCAEYVFVSRSLLAFSNAVLKVIDTHDIFSNRDQAIERSTGMKSQWLSASPVNEAAGLDRAHRVLGIQPDESEHLRSMTRAEVTTVGHFFQGPSKARPVSLTLGAGDILFVGSNSPINRHGIEWFIRDVLPKVLERQPGIRLRVVGAVANTLSDEFKGAECVDLIGPVNDLAAEYAGASLVINPILFGTGLAIKSIEALSHGKALICTTVGSRGIRLQESQRQPMLLADEPTSFAAGILHLLQHAAARRDLETRASNFISTWNDEQLDGLKRAFAPVDKYAMRATDVAVLRP